MKTLFALTAAVLITGCASNSPKSQQINTVIDDNAPKTTLQVCRPSKLVVAGHIPDLIVDGEIIGEVGNGSNQVFDIPVGAKLVIQLSKNFLMQRFDDEVLYEGVAEDNPSYVIIAGGEPNWELGLKMLFQGEAAAIAASRTSKHKWWTVFNAQSLEELNKLCLESK